MTFDPASVEVLCVTLPKDRCVQVPWKYIEVPGSKYVDTVTFFAKKKKLIQRSLTSRWPLTPHLLRSHVWLYPRIIVSKSHENTSKYVDTVNLFAKTWTKGHWPLDDVTCVTLPKDHCVQVPWEYINVCGYSDQFCKLPHTYTPGGHSLSEVTGMCLLQVKSRGLSGEMCTLQNMGSFSKQPE